MVAARIRDVVTATSTVFGVSRRDIMGKARYKHIVHARKAAYYAARLEGHAFAAIGRVMDRDHSTVMHGCNEAEWFVERDDKYADAIETIRQLAAEGNLVPIKLPTYLETLQQQTACDDEEDAIEAADKKYLKAAKAANEAFLKALEAA